MNIVINKEKLKHLQEEKQTQKRHTILLVDDEPANLESLAMILEPEYNIIQATNGFEALSIIQSDPHPERINLIISDQRMPGMLGVEFLKQSIPIIPRTTRIILTGFTDVNDIIDSINDGQIYKFLTKPIDPAELLMSTKRALEVYDLQTQNIELLKQLKRINENLERAVDERTLKLKENEAKLSKQNLELAELNATKNSFFSIIAHDLRSPLGSLVDMLEMLNEESYIFSEAEKKNIFREMKNSAKLTYSLLENLLKWAMIQKGEMKFEPAITDFNLLLRDSINLLSGVAKGKNILVKNNTETDINIYVDEKMITTVLRNLISNAIKFTPKNGIIEIFCYKTEYFLEVHIVDNGIGMSKEHCGNLFKITNKMNTRGTEGEKGTGLGLILCKEFVEKNGGVIRVESEINKGSRFIFTVPLGGAK